MDLKQFIRDVADFPKPGILFKDITPLIKSPEGFSDTIRQLASRYREQKLDKIIGIESRGFIFAAALAYELGAGMVPVRKVGKLPAKCLKETYELEYGTDCLEIHEDALERGERVLVLDDVIATGGTIAATCRLANLLGANLIEAATVIELTFLPGREKLGEVPFYSLIQY
jgi:adenine phosphoribosyltransferase